MCHKGRFSETDGAHERKKKRIIMQGIKGKLVLMRHRHQSSVASVGERGKMHCTHVSNKNNIKVNLPLILHIDQGRC